MIAELKRWFTAWDTLQTIYMKMMQYNASNIKTDSKQVWSYFICRTMQLGYTGTMMNLKIVLKNPQKITA